MARARRPGKQPRVREAAEKRYAPEAEVPPLTGVLFDSDVIIEILRGDSKIVDAVMALEASGTPTYCSPVNWAEIYAGIRPGEESLTEAFFQARGEVLLDAEVGRKAGAYLARHSASRGVRIADALIAAAATTSGLRLWTLNRRHYPIEELEFYEPLG
jgi:predicted nucleic acid-binding protein